jgi:antitoxin VapB
MIELPEDVEALARKIAVARGMSVEAAVAWAVEEGARRTGLPRPRRRQTSAQMLAVGDEIAALPLLDSRSPQQLMQELNAL